MPAADPYPPRGKFVMLLRGLMRHCPRCGGGKLFKRWFTMVERCPRCGMKFAREEGFFLGSFTINFGVVLIALAAFIAVGVAVSLPDPSAVKLSAGAMLVALIVPTLCYPFSKTIWSAFDLIMKPLEPKELEEATQGRR